MRPHFRPNRPIASFWRDPCRCSSETVRRRAWRICALVIVPVLSIGLDFARAAGLPDPGQDLCVDASNLLVACTSINTRDGPAHPRHGGRFGREAQAAAGTAVSVGAGAGSFDYTKVANNGSDLGAGAELGPGLADWACARDNSTGLTWEVKTSNRDDLRFAGHTYTWYFTDAASNGSSDGNIGCDTCNGTLAAYANQCNTQNYIAAINAAALCGHADWRMPTQRELLTLVQTGLQNTRIDARYFPNTTASDYWSGSTHASRPTYAWLAPFYPGAIDTDAKSCSYSLRLVRGG